MSNIVTIVGKTNVGKSTLFNRIISRKDAIVGEVPGITRDRHYAIGEWCGHTFHLIDTGGYMDKASSNLMRQINEQVDIAIQEGSVIVFVVDCKTGITAEDTAIAEKLRKSNKPLVLVANKADNPSLSIEGQLFYTLGLGDVHEISAAHGTGTGDLLDAVVGRFRNSSGSDSVLSEGIPKVALVGRTNTGKSTFLNALLNKNRGIVANEPHTTRVPTHNHYRLYHKDVILIDTAGISKKHQISKQSISFYALIRTIKAIEKADVCVVFVDAQEGLTQQDKKIVSLAHRKKKGILLIVNKADTLNTTNNAFIDYKKKVREALGSMDYFPILFTSGQYKKNIYQTIEKALEVYANRKKHLPTSTLNNVVQDAIRQNPLPFVQGKAIKINYVTQLHTPWPMFVLFCNRPKHIPANYKRYLEKKIRAFTRFEGAPILLSFRRKSQRHK